MNPFTEGMRVRVVSPMTDDPLPPPVGALGTVRRAYRDGTGDKIDITWDPGIIAVSTFVEGDFSILTVVGDTPEPTEEDLLDYLDSVRALVFSHGWAVQGVLDDPPFAYTVGLAEKGLPEVITIGLPHQVAQTMLNEIARKMVAGGAIEPGTVLDDLAVGYLATVIEVADSSELLTVANRMYALDEPVPALQLVFEDKDHRWPWEAGSTLAVRLLGPIPDQGGKRG